MEHLLLASAATDSVLSGLSTAGGANGAGYTENVTLATIVGNTINVILSFTGILFICLLVYAGFLYLTSAGEEKGVAKAKKLISSSIIGILIIVASYAITTYVFEALVDITS